MIGLVVAAYLLGSIPFGYLLVKYAFTRGEDVRQIGSGGADFAAPDRKPGAVLCMNFNTRLASLGPTPR